jgi:dCMP deaminase
MNAIAKVAKGTHSSDGAEMFITHSPCYDCSKAIIQSGIRKVYFKDSYRDNRPIEFLKRQVKMYNKDPLGRQKWIFLYDKH